MRPNLMSPRRSSGEDSILALLEREPAHKRGKGASGARIAWYGASAALALALTGALVWMAANNDGLRPEVQETVLAEAGTTPRGTSAALLQVAMAPAAAAPEAQPPRAAVIVDQPLAHDAVPPLRLLKPAPDRSPVEKPLAAPAPVPVPAPAPVRPIARTTPPSRPALGAPARPKPAVAAKSALRPVQPKAQRSVNPAKNPDGAVDADVALISAVIMHANGHAPEGSQMTELLCPNDTCQARPARQ